MPQQPAIDGLPLWAQLTISFIIGLATIAVAVKGYFVKDASSGVSAANPSTAAVLGASIADMGAIRHLSDVCIVLTGAVEQLQKSVDEHTHHERNNVEISREVCQRLRELCEELKRQGRDQRRWDKRDEDRR